MDTQCVSSGCLEMEQSDRQKVGESHKLSLMHFGVIGNFVMLVNASLVCSKTLILLETWQTRSQHLVD